MKFQFHSPHLSVTRLECNDDLPNFVVLTGPNGSGKTHFLRAIEYGRIWIDGAAKNGNSARFFDANSIVPNNVSSFSSQTIASQKNNLLNQLDNLKNAVRQDLNQYCGPILNSLRGNLTTVDFSDPILFLEEHFELPQIYSTEVHSQSQGQLLQLRQRYAAIEHQMVTNQGMQNGKLYEYCKKRNIKVATISRDLVEMETFDLWGQINAFQQNLGQVFVAYRDMSVQNKLKKLDKTENLGSNVRFFEPEQFTDFYGEPPWDFINRIFAESGLPFKVNQPSMYNYGDFLVELTKNNKPQPIPFSDLSSGEKVLMAFALCLYQVRDGRQIVSFPEVLLFDEIDAPLHPSMVKTVVDTIRRELVDKKGIKVILTTHSSTTVAMCPSESIFVMQESRLVEKIDTDRALRLLTYGIPTLSISTDARRQVLVESRFDRDVYASLFEKIKTQINSDRSLEFIAASGAERHGSITNENGGCSVVKSLVNQLTEAGNASVYGLIDWDVANTTTARVIVLGQHKRYSIENFLLDPCLLGLLLIKENHQEAINYGLITPTSSYMELANSPPADLQMLADKVSTLLSFEGTKVTCKYANGMELEIAQDLLQIKGHDLSAKVFEKFKFLRTKKDNALLLSIVNQVLSDKPKLIPIELVQAFEDILNK